MRNLPGRAVPRTGKYPLRFGAQGLLELMGTTLMVSPKYVLKHLPPGPGRLAALQNNLSNRDKASQLGHPPQTTSRALA